MLSLLFDAYAMLRYGTKGTLTLTGWTELTFQRVGGTARVVSESGSYDAKKGNGGAGGDETKQSDSTGEATTDIGADGVEVLLVGRDSMPASPEMLMLQRLAGVSAGAREVVTFDEAAKAQAVLDALLSSNGEWTSVASA